MAKDKYINCRVDEGLKESIDAILKEINEGIFNEAKKNYRYAFEFLKECYINNPNYSDILLEVELKQKLNRLKEERKIIDFQIAEAEKELKEINERINKPVNEREIIITPALKRAIEILLSNCKQQNITNFEEVPEEMINAIANTCKVRKDDLLILSKKEF